MEIARAAPAQRQQAVARFIDELVAEIEPLQRSYNEATWMASITGASEHVAESARLDAQIRKVFARPEPYGFLREIRSRGGVSDRLLQRQASLLFDQFRAHQIAPETIEQMVRIEKDLDQRFNNFRARIDGQRVSDNQIREVLRTSDDVAERRRAWEASKQIGAEVAGELLELVRLRNRSARELEFDNYYSMMLELDELDERELFGLLDELERGTRPLFEAYKRDLDGRLARRFGTPVEDLRPWHYGDPFFQEAPAPEYDLDPCFKGLELDRLTERFFGAIGLEVRDLLERADLYERPGKSQHAFCLSVDRASDIRVLCNLRPNEFWMGVMLHEFGHAVYDKYIEGSLPYVLRVPAHTLTTEASAMLFGRLSKSPAWLTRYAGMPAGEARSAGEVIGRTIRTQLLVQTRWNLVMCHMERALYRDPEQDLDRLWWDLVEEFQWVRRPEDRRAPDWASKIHFSVAPVYYHNYMLGEILASQLQSHLLRELLGGAADAWDRYVASPEVGSALIDRLYRGGKSLDWREAIRRASGQELSPAAFVDDLAGRLATRE